MGVRMSFRSAPDPPSPHSNVWHPKSHPQLRDPGGTWRCPLTKPPSATQPSQIKSRLPSRKAETNIQDCFLAGVPSTATPTGGLSPLISFFLKEQRPLLENNKMQCVWFTFLISLRNREISYKSVFLTPEPLFLHKYLIGQLSKCYFLRLLQSLTQELLGDLGETLVRVLFSIFLLFLEAYTLCITKTMAQLCLTLYFDCWEKKKKSIDVSVAVHSDFIAEWGCPCPCQAGGRRHPLSPPPPRAVENLSTSLFVKEYFAPV